MERDERSHVDAVRVALDAIHDLKETGLDTSVARKLDDIAQALRAGTDTAPRLKRRVFGTFAGQFSIGPEFFEPMSEDDRRAWAAD